MHCMVGVLFVFKETNMYGKGLGVANAATGITLLTPQHNHVLFVIGAILLLSGAVILTASIIVSRKQSTTE